MVDVKEIQSAIERMKTVNIKGKQYTMVAQRVEAFRVLVGAGLGMSTDILTDDDKRVVIRAQITSPDGHVVASGMAEELRGVGINKTACIENCETSAVGRALANFGLHGGEYASADEIEKVDRTKEKQKELQAEAEAQAKPTEEPQAKPTEEAQAKPTPKLDEPPFDNNLWRQFVDEQKRLIDMAQTKIKLTSLQRRTRDERAQLQEVDRELYAELMDHWNNKFETLNTGER